MSLTPLSTDLSAPITSTSASQAGNPYNQLVAMMADENQRVQAERAKSALAIEVIAKSMAALTSEMQKTIASQAAKLASLETALIKVESQNKIVHDQKEALTTANTELVKAANAKADLLQKQIDTIQKAKIIEKFNASLEGLKNEVRKHQTSSIRNTSFVPANTGLLVKTISLLNSIKHSDQAYQKLENDIKAHQKTPVQVPRPFFAIAFTAPRKVGVVSWVTINSDLFKRILLLQPLLVPS